MDLIHVHDAIQVADNIAAPLPSPIKNAIASTVLSLTEIQRAFDQDGSLSSFLPEHLLLLPPRVQGVQAPEPDTLRYLNGLAMRANKAAESLSCSSVLAGQGSENDDTGDVALWLGNGDYGPGKEKNVLAILELSSWLEQGANVSTVELSSFKSTLPSTLHDGSPSPQIQDLVDTLRDMTDMYCFRVSSPGTAPLVVFILLGRCATDKASGWAGLLGIGTWSDQ